MNLLLFVVGLKMSEDLGDKLKQDIQDFKQLKERLLTEEHLDEDGYPTEAALELVGKWHWSDMKGWFEFIKSIWWYSEWGWKEKDEPHDWGIEETVHRYYISTGGWSGNESIIGAMKENEWTWHFAWLQSRRGGHYIFEDRDFKIED